MPDSHRLRSRRCGETAPLWRWGSAWRNTTTTVEAVLSSDVCSTGISTTISKANRFHSKRECLLCVVKVGQERESRPMQQPSIRGHGRSSRLALCGHVSHLSLRGVRAKQGPYSLPIYSIQGFIVRVHWSLEISLVQQGVRTRRVSRLRQAQLLARGLAEARFQPCRVTFQSIAKDVTPSPAHNARDTLKMTPCTIGRSCDIET